MVPTQTLSVAESQFFPLQDGVGCSLAPFYLGTNSAKQGVKNVTVLNADRGLACLFACKHLMTMYSFPYLEPVGCFMSNSNCCFLTCIRFLRKQVRRSSIPVYLRIFHRFVVIYTAKGFGVVNKAEVVVFLELSCFFDDPTCPGNLHLIIQVHPW